MDFNFVLASSAVAIEISKDLSDEDLTLLSTFLTSIADDLALISSQRLKKSTRFNSD